MPNLDPWINQNSNNNEETTIISNFEYCLGYVRDQYETIRLNADHPISNERYEKIIEMINYTFGKYKEAVLIIINNIFNELEKKRKIAINKNGKDPLNDELEIYRLEEITLDYVLYIILEFAGN